MPVTRIPDHATRAIGRLLTQFRNSADIKGVLNALSAQVQELENALIDTYIVHNKAQAANSTLEAIGRLVGAPDRGGLSDAEFLKRINAQILVNSSDGTTARMLSIRAALVTDSQDVLDSPPACIVIRSAKHSTADIDPTYAEAVELIGFLKKAAAAGVRVVLWFRKPGIAANQAFAFADPVPVGLETPAGFDVGKFYDALI